MSCGLSLLPRSYPSRPMEVLPGLRLGAQGLELIADLFFCCRGQGVRYDREKNRVILCTLEDRLRLVRGIYDQCQATWMRDVGAYFLEPLSQAQFGYSGRWCESLPKEQKADLPTPGRTLSRPAKPEEISALWKIALHQSWCFGLRAEVLHLSKHQIEEKIFFWSNHNTQIPQVLFLEGVTNLRDRTLSNRLGIIVSWCEKTLTPLWLSFTEINETPKKSKPADTLDNALLWSPAMMVDWIQHTRQERANAHKLYLSKDTLSRLKLVNEGYEAFI